MTGQGMIWYREGRLHIFRNPVDNGRHLPQGARPGVLQRGLLFALLWWILVEGANESWWVGIPAILLVTASSAALLAPVNLVWRELFRFIPFFLIRSLVSGADVAWRALHPRMPIAPDLIVYPLRLSPGLPQVFMANTVSLLPGTLSAALDSNCLTVHVLNKRKDILRELETLERKIAALFGAPFPSCQMSE
jgi:multicomponent Na+:H+ antiporter subunit E